MLEINLFLVKNLIKEQFKQYADLEIKPVEASGWDNRTFRLGNNTLIRLPSAKKYVNQVEKEQLWLPRLAKHLSIKIPNPIALGKPSKDYPWHWSIYEWIEGKSANIVPKEAIDFKQLATFLAKFLNELHRIDPKDGPENPFRGANLLRYDSETKSFINNFKSLFNEKELITIWSCALNSKWNKKPVWYHGDLYSGNIIIKDNKLEAVIDFGSTAVGDPACDLVMYWAFLSEAGGKIFKSELKNMDKNTWNRARGWALWKALYSLNSLGPTEKEKFNQQKLIIENILAKP